MDRLQTMQVYVHIVEGGSFTRAAEALQLHRPAVSKAVQQLEQELGIRLLNRSTRKVSTTAEGEEFYKRCLEVLASVNDTFASFSQQRVLPKGRLRFDVAVTLAKAIIIPALPAFQQKYPQIDLVLGASDHPVDLISGGVDCAVRLGEHKDSSIVARKIGAIPMVTCGSPAYLSRHGVPHTLDDLRRHKAVNFFSGRNRRVMEWAFCPGGESVTLKLDSGIQTDDSEAFLSCGLAGFGLLQGLRPSLQPYISSGQLIEVLQNVATVPKPVSIMYPSRTHLPTKVRVFIDWLSELIGRQYPA